MDIEIQTRDNMFIFDLLETKQISSDVIKPITENANLVYKRKFHMVNKSMNVPPEIINFSILFLSGVASGIISNWLWDKIKGKEVTKIKINNKEVDFEEGIIKRTVEETIEMERPM
jgi:hypothetical protein